jgi:hypothetical protein
VATLEQMMNRRYTETGGGTRGTLASEGLYQRPVVSNQGLAGTGVQTVANQLAYGRQVAPEGLVENRLNNLTASNSPYINQARMEARRYAASRGLGNSAFAGAAGIEAAIRQGLPIAQADAGAINTAASQTQDSLNQNLMQERDLMNQATMAAANRSAVTEGLANAGRDAAADRQFQLQLQRERLGYEGEQAGLDRSHQYNMTGFEYGLRDNLADNDTFRQDWMADQNFTRDQYAGMVDYQRQMATLGYAAEIDSTQSFRNMLNQYALENPDVFNAEDYARIGTYMQQESTRQYSNIFRRWMGG